MLGWVGIKSENWLPVFKVGLETFSKDIQKIGICVHVNGIFVDLLVEYPPISVVLWAHKKVLIVFQGFPAGSTGWRLVARVAI